MWPCIPPPTCECCCGQTPHCSPPTRRFFHRPPQPGLRPRRVCHRPAGRPPRWPLLATIGAIKIGAHRGRVLTTSCRPTKRPDQLPPRLRLLSRRLSRLLGYLPCRCRPNLPLTRRPRNLPGFPNRDRRDPTAPRFWLVILFFHIALTCLAAICLYTCLIVFLIVVIQHSFLRIGSYDPHFFAS